MTGEPLLFDLPAETAGSLQDRASRFRSRAHNRVEPADSENYFPTPSSGTRALLEVERFDGPIWEPACGEGHMSRALEAAGYEVVSTDLYDRGYGMAGRDFLAERVALAPNIVTNPPYCSSTLAFVAHAISLATGKTAMLLRLSWLEGQKRGQFFRQCPPARVWVFSSRLTIHKNVIGDESGGVVAYAWMVWEPGATETRLGWIDPIWT